jgi:hypothetical protein
MASKGATSAEVFILGEDWGSCEQFVPRENFNEDEIRAKHSRRYYATDGRSIYACPVGMETRQIALATMGEFFAPRLQFAARVLSCNIVYAPDVVVEDAFALVLQGTRGRATGGVLYGEHREGKVISLYGMGVRPMEEFAVRIAAALARFCKAYNLLLLLHDEHPLDVTDPAVLLDVVNER